MSTSTRRRNFLDRTGATLSRPTAGQWRCATPDGRLVERAASAGRAIDALRATVFGPLMRAPVAPTRWLTPL